MELADRDSIEADFGADLGRLTAKQHAELKRLLGNPPNVANVPASFWEQARIEREELLALFLLALATENAIRHGGGISPPVRQTISSWATRRAREVSTGFIERARQTVAAQVSAGAAGREAASASFNNSRDSGLAVTETTAASVFGGETGAASVGMVSDDDLWEIHPELSESGVCPVCEPFANTPRSYWGKIHPNGPPLHPNCKCRIRYKGKGSNNLPRPIPPTSGAPVGPVFRSPSTAAILALGGIASSNARTLGMNTEQLAAIQGLDGATLLQVNRRLEGRSSALSREAAKTTAKAAKAAIAMLPVARNGALYLAFGDSAGWDAKRPGDSIRSRGFVHLYATPPAGKHLLVVDNPMRAKSITAVLSNRPADSVYLPGASFRVVSREVRGAGVILRVREDF